MSLAWGGHQNGRIPTSALTPIGRGALPGGIQFGKEQYAHPAAAAAWFRLRDAVQTRTGVRMGVAEGYRDLALQQHYWNTLPFPMAATPGTSNHGWGRAIDMYGYTAAALRAVRDLGPGLGWSLATGDRVGEPWHIEYVGSLTVTTTTSPEEDDMPKLIRRVGESTLEWSLFDPSLRGPSDLERGYIVITNQNTARDLARLYYPGGFGDEQKEPRSVYVEMQKSARIVHQAYQRGLPAATTSSGGFTDSDRSTLNTVRAVVEAIRDAFGRVFR
ncbi:M15 family metallopeptidase [Microcella alkaliphila]|uniref:Serine-type D-Ala-D-Ala carboxypeptidase superfa mily n=1 Tax=Microcella alkaliphila TaxID=279828 RepID=A0A0U5BDZ4_9MICO|nr:M15 family metallopeptidase [Microcella alkaliphila]BAU32447.1 serine-type D-Ala-D-Ala carboxypeptidase superfa mily [Microcella alkaliphila]